MIPTITDPKLSDLAFKNVTDVLEANLSWLNKAYGKVKRYPDKDPSGKMIYHPKIFRGGNDDRKYLSLYPDAELGNYSFFHANDSRQTIVQDVDDLDFASDVALVVWGNIESIYPADFVNRTERHVIDEVIDVLTTKSLNGTRFNLTTWSEEARNIFKDFTFDEVKDQFLIRPYFGFAIYGTITFNKIC